MFFSTRARAGERVSVTPGVTRTNAGKTNRCDTYTPATQEEASQFVLETNMQEEIDKGNIPYAVHAWEKHYKGDVNKLI